MTRHLLFAIALIGIGVLNSPAAAAEMQCEDRAANCVGDVPTGRGAGDWGYQNKCLPSCDRKLIRCIRNVASRR
jgi:hypothetical protein